MMNLKKIWKQKYKIWLVIYNQISNSHMIRFTDSEITNQEEQEMFKSGSDLWLIETPFFALKKDTKYPIYINADVPEEIRKADYLLRNKIRQLKSEKINYTITHINYRTYDIESGLITYKLEPNYEFSENRKDSFNQEGANNFLEEQEME